MSTLPAPLAKTGPAEPSSKPVCRGCGTVLHDVFLDLGLSPLSNAFVRPEQLERGVSFFPLCARVCRECLLVQVDEVQRPDQIFAADYAYFSSYSSSWLEHARRYVAAIVPRCQLGPHSRVVEIASNDGYLLQHFVERGIPCLGVEPAANAAAAAKAKGVDSWIKFFGTATARELVDAGWRADLLIGNNVLAHVPDLNDFIAGLRLALAPAGVITLEFPHLMRLMAERQFDTIYHEHFSYLSLRAAECAFQRHQLRVFDVEELPTHGGSLRLHVRHEANPARPETERLAALRATEERAGLGRIETYLDFPAHIESVKLDLLDFLITARRAGKKVAGYGAPAKGNTLLNYCGIKPDLLAFTVDRSPLKQGTLLPGTLIPVFAPTRLRETRPDYVLILPWNLQDEIKREMAEVLSWDGRFVTAVPELKVHAV